MSTEKVRGIVIREVPVGESDKIITLLTKELGKITLSARGARKAKSKYLASCELFAYSDFVVYTARKHLSVSSAVLIDNFYNLRTDLNKMAAAVYAAEFCGKMIYEGTDCTEYMLLFLTLLKFMEKGKAEPLFGIYIFELKFLALSGMLPDYGHCCKCGKEINGGGFAANDGVLCRSCGKEKNAEISQGSIRALRYISGAEILKVFSFRVSNSVFSEIEYVRKILTEAEIDFRFKSFELLREVYGKGNI